MRCTNTRAQRTDVVMNPALNCLSQFLAGEPIKRRQYLWSYLRVFKESVKRINCPLFFCGKVKLVLACFPSLSAKSYISRKINLHRNLVFSYRQDTKQVDHAGQKPLFDVSFQFCNKDIWVKKAFSSLRQLR